MPVNVANELLLKLLKQVDRGGRVTVPITDRSAKNYFQHQDLDSRASIHAALENAEKADCIGLEWGRGVEAQDLKRIRLKDADKLAEYLGVSRARTHADWMEEYLQPIINQSPGWLIDAYKSAHKKWYVGKPVFGIENNQYDEAGILFRIALAISRGEQAGQDLRHFSIKLLNDSKAIEKRLARLANLLRNNPEWSEFQDNHELFRLLGLEKFPPPLLIRGPLHIKYQETDFDISYLCPYVGLSPDNIIKFKLLHESSYMLTVENLASFQRHVREIDDFGIVIYTNGFPAPALVKILKMLDETLPETCQFFHWGDQDVGGLRIFSKIEEAYTKHLLSSHLMTETVDPIKPFTDENRKAMHQYVSDQSQAGILARSWLQTRGIGLLEQESLDPKPPV